MELKDSIDMTISSYITWQTEEWLAQGKADRYRYHADIPVPGMYS